MVSKIKYTQDSEVGNEGSDQVVRPETGISEGGQGQPLSTPKFLVSVSASLVNAKPHPGVEGTSPVILRKGLGGGVFHLSKVCRAR